VKTTPAALFVGLLLASLLIITIQAEDATPPPRRGSLSFAKPKGLGGGEFHDPESTTLSENRRAFPDTTDGIHVFNDQLATWSMTEAQFQFAATHYAGSQ